MWILADTQFHHVEGKPFFDALEDGFVEVAIRPPALDLFAPALLSSVLQTMAARPERPIFFLGDAANVSCVDEYDRFLATMGSAPWLGVIGNHDGYFIGNNEDQGGVTKNWKSACANGPQRQALLDRLSAWETARFGTPKRKTYSHHNAMSKATAIALYLVGLQDRGLIKDDPLTKGWTKGADKFWHYTTTFELAVKGENLPVILEAVVSSAEVGPGDDEWDAYLLQDVLIPSRKTHVILVDTSDYESRPTGRVKAAAVRCWLYGRCTVPGVIGNIAETQSNTILGWVANAEKNNEDFFLMGHHNWDSLSKQTLERLEKAEDSTSFITYVSGHEHNPTSKVKAEGAREDWEVNIGSVTDYPQQFAAIAYQPTTDQNVKATRLEVVVHDVASRDVKCEVEYSPDTQSCYFGDDYHRQVREITKLMIERLVKEPGLASTSCDAKNCLEPMLKKINSAPISEVTQFVRDKLLLSDWAKGQAFACAAHAARMEREYRCGKAFLAARLSRIWKGLTPADIEKAPVEGGTAITSDTGTFTIHRGPQW